MWIAVTEVSQKLRLPKSNVSRLLRSMRQVGLLDSARDGRGYSPGLMLVGGLGLLWVAYKLLADTGDDAHDGPVASTFWGAMKTIVVADALMGIDNVLGVAGAAHGSMDLVILGLLISVPIMVLGSSVVLRLVERFPIIITVGAAVLAFTAAKMIIEEPLLDPLFDASGWMPTVARIATYVVAVAGVLGLGWWTLRRDASAKTSSSVA